MVDVWVSEYEALDNDGHGHVLPLKKEPAIATDKQTLSGATEFTLDSDTRIVQIYADALVHVQFDGTDADTDDEPLTASTIHDRAIRADTFTTLSIIAG